MNQKLCVNEIIIVDGASKDNTIDIIKDTLRNTSIKWKLIAQDYEKFPGPAGAREQGVFESKSEYIAFLDSDDFWYPEKLNLQLTDMVTNDYSFTYTAVNYIFPDGKQYLYEPPSILYNFDNYFTMRGIVLSSVVMKRKMASKVIKYYGHDFAEDTCCWLKAFECGFEARMSTVIGTAYFVHPKSRSFNFIRCMRDLYKIYKEFHSSSMALLKLLLLVKNNLRRKIYMIYHGFNDA